MRSIKQYTVLGAIFFMVASWLVPNHYWPWTTFHADFIMAVGLCIPSIIFFFLYRKEVVLLSMSGVFSLFFAVLSIGYYVLNVVDYRTQSFMPALYFFGLFFAIALGQLMARFDKTCLEYILFIPPLVAAIASVGLQLAQWLWVPMYAVTDIWIMPSNGIRPSANLNQPNQLASLLLWGVVSCYWLHMKRLLGVLSLAFIAGFLCFGIGLTLSRSALLSFFLISLLVLVFKYKFIKKPHILFWLVCATSLFCAWSVHLFVPTWLGLVTEASVDINLLSRGGTLRLQIWQMFIDAIHKKPWLGYGPQMTTSAQFAVLEFYPELSRDIYSNAHNIFLDLMVWFGIPLVLLLGVFFSYWIFTLLASVRKSHDVDVLFVFVLLVMFVHANLELPLHHAYFLLPVGVLVGALTEGLKHSTPICVFNISVRWLSLGMCCMIFCLGFLFKEYMELERQVFVYRFKAANILKTSTPVVPSAYFLDQLSEQLWFYMLDEKSLLSRDELNRALIYIESNKYCDALRGYRKVVHQSYIAVDIEDLDFQISKKCGSL